MTNPARSPLLPVPERPRTAYTAAELMAMTFPEITWAVPGMVAEGVTLLAGPPKIGKSWLSLGLALAIARGGAAFGRIDVDPGPVLYLALEDTPRRLQSRMRRVLGGQPAPAALTLDTYCPALPAGGVEHICDWLDTHPGARLVVIDVFAKVRGAPTPGANAYDADYHAMSRVKRIADHYAVPIILVHHVRKAAADDFLATVSGTNGIAGAADAVLVLERGRNNADGVLHMTGRDVEENDYALSFDADRGAWDLLDGPAVDHTLADTRARLLHHVRDHPGTRPKDAATALADLDPATVRQTLTRMHNDGQLTRDPTSRYYAPLDPLGGDTPRPVTAVTASQHPLPPAETAVTAPVTAVTPLLLGRPEEPA